MTIKLDLNLSLPAGGAQLTAEIPATDFTPPPATIIPISSLRNCSSSALPLYNSHKQNSVLILVLHNQFELMTNPSVDEAIIFEPGASRLTVYPFPLFWQQINTKM